MNFYQKYFEDCLSPLQQSVHCDGSVSVDFKLGPYTLSNTNFERTISYQNPNFAIQYFKPKIDKDDNHKGSFKFFTDKSIISFNSNLSNFLLHHQINKNISLVVDKKEVSLHFRKENEIPFLGNSKFDLTFSLSKRPSFSCSFISENIEASFSGTDEFFVSSYKIDIFPTYMVLGFSNSTDQFLPPFYLNSFNLKNDDRYPLSFGTSVSFANPYFGSYFIKNLKLKTSINVIYLSFLFSLNNEPNFEYIVNVNPLSPLQCIVHSDNHFFEVTVNVKVTDKLILGITNDQITGLNNYSISYDVDNDIGRKSLTQTSLFKWIQNHNPFNKFNSHQ